MRVYECERERERMSEIEEGKRGEQKLHAANHSAIGQIRLDVDAIARQHGEGREMFACHRQGCFLVTLWRRAVANLETGGEISRSSGQCAARKLRPRRAFLTPFARRRREAARSHATTHAYRNDPANDTGSGWYRLSMTPR